MHNEATTCPDLSNVFAVFIDATISAEAHARMSARVVKPVIRRPLDERLVRRTRRADFAALADFDAAVDAEEIDLEAEEPSGAASMN